MGYAILRIAKVKSLSAAHSICRHNSRKVEVITANPDIKNPRIIIPEVEENQQNYPTYTKFFKAKTSGQTVRKDAVRALELVMSFSKDSIKDSELRDWTKSCIEFIKENFGGSLSCLYDFKLHIDEMGAPHCHALLICLDDKGKLNARYYINGAKKLSELQDKYAEKMKPFGLERGKDKRLTKSQHKDSKQWHKEQSEKETRLKTYEKLFGKPLDWNLTKRMHYYDVYNELIKQNEERNKKPKIRFNDIEK